MVWRAAYGLSFLPLNGAGGAGGIQQTGYARRTPLVTTIGGGLNSYIPALPGTGSLERPYPNGMLPSLGSSLGAKTQVGQAVSYQNREYKVPRVHQFHVGFEYELPWKVVAEASYVGSRTTHFAVSRQLGAISLEERLKGFADPNYLNATVPNPFAGAPELAGTGLGSDHRHAQPVAAPLPAVQRRHRNGLSVGDTSYDGARDARQ